MCIQDNIQSKIAQLTQDGDTIAIFLADTLQGSTDPTVKICHRMDAAKLLTKYGFPQQTNNNIVPFNSKEDDVQYESSPPPMSAPTLRDIVAYPVARYIRNRTDDGEILVHALCQIMNGGEYRQDPFTGEPQQTVKPRERLAAAKELLRRAFGEAAAPRRASQNPIYPDHPVSPNSLTADLAKLIRERTNNGIEAAELMIRIAENDDDEGDWLPAHRLSAAKELLHRAYDLNYDAVTWEHLDAYNNAAYPLDLNEEAERAQHRERMTALIKEYDEARAADDEDAMAATEKKYADYIKRGRKSDPEEQSEEYLEHGPNDPDPTVDYYYPPLSKEEQAKFDEETRRNSAADIQTPKLTIPLNIRSP